MLDMRDHRGSSAFHERSRREPLDLLIANAGITAGRFDAADARDGWKCSL
jgi:hypothetical protein